MGRYVRPYYFFRPFRAIGQHHLTQYTALGCVLVAPMGRLDIICLMCDLRRVPVRWIGGLTSLKTVCMFFLTC